MVCLSRLYYFKFFKGCIQQILLGPLLNTLSQVPLTFRDEWRVTVVYRVYKLSRLCRRKPLEFWSDMVCLVQYEKRINCKKSNTDSNISHQTLCAIWYHLHNLKNVKNTHGGVLLLVKLQVLANGTKSRKATNLPHELNCLYHLR